MTTATLTDSTPAHATEIINKYVPWSMGAGLVPVPVLDIVALTGIQVKMLSDLSTAYGVEFSENRIKSIVLSLLSSLGTTALAFGALGSTIKAIPGLGTWLGVATLPVFAGATTYALGKVFMQHFESGGTFLNFDTLKAKKAFVETFEEGKREVVAASKKVDAKLSKALDV